MFSKEGVILSPSVASADQLALGRAVELAEQRGCGDLHVDIEDGNFVPNITFGEKTVSALCAVTGLPLSFHLMTTDQLGWLQIAARYRPLIVFGHLEQLAYPKAFCAAAKKLGVRCGLALNPKCPVATLAPYIDGLDGVLLLSVEPDGMGEHFLEVTYDRVSQVRSMSASVEIWVDGDITAGLLPRLRRCGATHAVVGRAFYQGDL